MASVEPDVGAAEHLLEQRLEDRAILAAADGDLDDPLHRRRLLAGDALAHARPLVDERPALPAHRALARDARSALAPHVVHPSPHRRQLLEASVQLLARRRALAVLVLAHDERVVLLLLARVHFLDRARLLGDRARRRDHLVAHAPRRRFDRAGRLVHRRAAPRRTPRLHAPRSRSSPRFARQVERLCHRLRTPPAPRRPSLGIFGHRALLATARSCAPAPPSCAPPATGPRRRASSPPAPRPPTAVSPRASRSASSSSSFATPAELTTRRRSTSLIRWSSADRRRLELVDERKLPRRVAGDLEDLHAGVVHLRGEQLGEVDGDELPARAARPRGGSPTLREMTGGTSCCVTTPTPDAPPADDLPQVLSRPSALTPARRLHPQREVQALEHARSSPPRIRRWACSDHRRATSEGRRRTRCLTTRGTWNWWCKAMVCG